MNHCLDTLQMFLQTKGTVFIEYCILLKTNLGLESQVEKQRDH